MLCVIRRLAAAFCILASLHALPAEARRVALVIGNAQYKIGPLANPLNDAAAVAAAFEKQLKFDKVMLRTNLGAEALRAALAEVSREVAGADLGVVYFAGHGTEVAGRNFLIPVDATLARPSALDLEAIPLDTVLGQLDGARRLKLVILDACRNNLFALPGAKRTVGRGLARVEPEDNTLVVYAARDGTTADDGVGRRHSPFTEALLKHIATPGLEINFVFRRVRDDVVAATNPVQTPHVYGTLGGKEVYLRIETAPPPVLVPPQPAIPPKQVEKSPAQPAEKAFDRIVEAVRSAVAVVQVEKPATDNKGKKLTLASGFFVSADGHLVTASALLDGATAINVLVGDNKSGVARFAAEVAGTDGRTGIALLRVKGAPAFPFLKLSTARAKLGDPVFAVGAPHGLAGTVLKGHVTGLDRDVNPNSPYDHMQTDIATSEGLLGSPLFSDAGDAIGALVVEYSPPGTSGAPKLAFALPAELVRDVVEQLKASGSVRRGWLGVRIQAVDQDIAASLGLAEAKGALVAEVTASSPAAEAGIKVGDAVLTINGVKVADSRDLARQIAGFAPGAKVDVKILRAQKELTVPVRLGLLPPAQAVPQQAPSNPSAPTAIGDLGFTVSTSTDSNQEGAVVIEVDSSSDAANKIRVNDVILEVGNNTVRSAGDLVNAVREANRLQRRAILLRVRWGNETRYVAVRLKGR